jgi:tRNA (guanine-N7-)-methyltransferase
MSVFVPADYFSELRREEIFPDPTRPIEVDLGSGDGTFLVEMARQHPERDFLGVERLGGRVLKTARKIKRAGLQNARVLQLESAYSVGWLLPSASISRLHLLCPDPWPKKRHHKNRLVNNAEFLAGLERILASGGEFLLKTDHEEFFENAIESLSLRPAFSRLEWPADAFFYPQTDFEKLWLTQGLNIHRARWGRALASPSRLATLG